jgi:hypothetical protein
MTSLQVSIREIAADLLARKYSGQTVLFLGSRTGPWYRNDALYERLKEFDLPPSFDRLSEAEKFAVCYWTLGSMKETFRHQLLKEILREQDCRKEDEYLAEIIKQNVFDTIITTRIDDFVERACVAAGMKDKQEFHVLDVLCDHDEEKPGHEAGSTAIVKVFGDRESRTSVIELRSEQIQELKRSLEPKLGRPLLMIGYDSVWDRGMEQVFPLKGGTLYYANTQALKDAAPLAQTFHQRNGKYCVDHYKSYGKFARSLSECLALHSPIPHGSPHPPELESGAKPVVFICYAREDERYMEELYGHLKADEKRGLLEIWYDKKIQDGQNWKNKIIDTIKVSNGAIVFVSQYSESSSFIQNEELPPLLEAWRHKEKFLIVVCVRNCVIHNLELNEIQAVNFVNNPLDGMTKSKRNEIWVRVTKDIEMYLGIT